jgi:putative peptide zinc metalloprotease protein
VWSRGSVLRRALAVGLSAAVATTLSWAWWPGPDTYRPIGPDERGLLSAVLPSSGSPAGALPPSRAAALPMGSAAETRLATGAPLQATFPGAGALPTEEDPQLALVLVPSQPGDQEGGAGAPTTGPDTSDPDPDDGTWVFPFDEPLPPEEGDNQALAVNTEDGNVTYDVAFALVWAADDEALNVNEAHAYASCQECVTVAVAFQVVLVVGDAQVVAPQNLAVAANYDCYECITAAIASQLVLTVSDMPGEEQLLALAAVWDELTTFAQEITSYTLTEITDHLEEFQEQITAILGAAPPVTSTAEPSSSPSSSTSPSPSPSPSASTGPTPAPTSTTSSPSPSPTSSPAGASTTPSPSPTPAESPSTTPSPSSEPTTDTPTTSPEPTTSP